MKHNLLLLLFLSIAFSISAQKKAELQSPNGEIKVSLSISDKIYYTISYSNDVLLENNHLSLNLGNETLGLNPKLSGQKTNKVNEVLTPVVPLKYSSVNNQYNSLLLTFKGDYSVEFRAFDDGIAYRFITNKKGDVEVLGEDFAINFPANYLLHLQQPGGFKTAYEESYTHVESNEWKATDRMSVLPVLIDTKKKYKILISESDLSDYPCMLDRKSVV